jgi:hypothetical protein
MCGETIYSDQDLADMHIMRGNAVVARPDWKTSASIHHRLGEHGNVATRVANRGRARSTAPAVQDILDAVHETAAISTRRVSV